MHTHPHHMQAYIHTDVQLAYQRLEENKRTPSRQVDNVF